MAMLVIHAIIYTMFINWLEIKYRICWSLSSYLDKCQIAAQFKILKSQNTLFYLFPQYFQS
jgi:hypothetical protein